MAIVLLAGIMIATMIGCGKNEKPSNASALSEQNVESSAGSEEGTSIEGEISEEELEQIDPVQTAAPEKPEGNGASVDVQQVVTNANETDEITFGIDVSRYQGTIHWSKVAESGVDFVMVRVGYRTLEDGKIVADSNAKYNMQEASKYGIKVGAYFFSTAVSKEEAIEEANWVSDYISNYKITYPVAFNCEGFSQSNSRQYHMTKTERTDVAMAFMNRIGQRGYTPMFYASKGELQNDTSWETSRIDDSYRIWVAQYPSKPYPETASSSYGGSHAMWQYTNQGTVPGISKPVDVNIAYFGYEKEEESQSGETPEQVGADVEALMSFTEVNEQVTAKDKTNLRDIPSQGSDSTVKTVLENGQVATRTGKSSSGWSRVVYNGNTYYAVSSYLTTDLSYTPPTPEPPEPDDGIKTKFTSVNEQVTAKDAVNLRTLPSVTNEQSQVVVKISNGEVVTRTGINNEVGWSRVEYNGQTLYCVSSYLTVVE
ncbi:MAG: glycoside hydrolase family 25 [Eubacterium sp.]|nr:glycoside hydrolase family 25 [Eubacterium sp.]